MINICQRSFYPTYHLIRAALICHIYIYICILRCHIYWCIVYQNVVILKMCFLHLSAVIMLFGVFLSFVYCMCNCKFSFGTGRYLLYMGGNFVIIQIWFGSLINVIITKMCGLSEICLVHCLIYHGYVLVCDAFYYFSGNSICQANIPSYCCCCVLCGG